MTLTRRALFKGMGASLLLSPSIVRASSLDYVSRAPKGIEAFQALLDEARRTGRTVYIPPGTHRICDKSFDPVKAGMRLLLSGDGPPPSLTLRRFHA